MAETRLDEACKHIFSLKAQIQKLEAKLDKVNEEKDKTREREVKWQHAKLLMAEMKGEMGTKIATVEKDLVHAQEALAGERERSADLQVICIPNKCERFA